jgi:hypothetical protein
MPGEKALLIKHFKKRYLVAGHHTCNPNTQEAEARRIISLKSTWVT